MPAVWLARSADAKARVMLTRTGEADYQINLADPEVYALLRTAGQAGEFLVINALAAQATVHWTYGIKMAIGKQQRAAKNDRARAAC